jgi:hypothetical protein
MDHNHADQIGGIGEPIHINFNLAEIFATMYFCQKRQENVLCDFGCYNSTYFRICLPITFSCKSDECFLGIAVRISEDEYNEASQNEHVYI